MAAVTSLTETKIQELMSGWVAVGLSQDEINALITVLRFNVDGQSSALAEFYAVTLPQLEADLSASSIAVSELTSTIIPDLEADISNNESALLDLNTVTLPLLDERVTSNGDWILELDGVTLPALYAQLDANDLVMTEFNDVTLPALNTRLDAAEAAVAAIDLTGLTADLDAAEAAISTLNTNLGTLNTDLGVVEAKFPITAPDIAAGAVTANKIFAHTITALEIAADTITANEIAANAITVNELAAGSVTAAKIAADTITANEIAANAITVDELAANAVTAAKIAANTITAAQIAADTITAAQIAANAITASEIAAGAVTASKILADTITANEIATGAITANEIAAGAVTAAKILAHTITANEIAADTITANEIAADSITASEIAVRTITAAEIAVGTITASEIAAGTITALNIDVDNLAAAVIATGILQAQLTITGSLKIDGANMGWSAADGLYLGTLTRFYDDSRTNQIDGDLVTSSISVKTGLSIGGSADLHGSMVMGNGVPDPTGKMSLGQTWPKLVPTIYGDGTGDNSNVWQDFIDWSSTEWLTSFNFFGAGYRKVNKVDGSWAGDLTVGSWSTAFYPGGGLAKIGTDLYIIGSDGNRSGDYYIYKTQSSGTINKLAELRITNISGFSSKRVRLVTDGTNVGMIWTNTSGDLKLRWYNPGLTAAVGGDITLIAGLGVAHIGGAHYGIGQAGGTTRLWVSLHQGDANMVRCFTTAGARVATEDFPRASNNTVCGLAYDSIGERMSSFDKTGNIWLYSKYVAGGTLNGQYTNYDGDNSVYPAGTIIGGIDKSGLASGFHETVPSPLTSYTLSKRAWPTISAPPAPDELVTDVTQVDKANRLGIYASVGGTPRLQDYAAVGVRSIPVTDALSTSGALAGSSGVPTFATAAVPSPGRFRSLAELPAGSPIIDLYGSGAGRAGHLRWSEKSRPLNFGTWTTATTQSIATSTFVKRTGWAQRDSTNSTTHGISYSAGDFTVSQSGLWFISAGVTVDGTTLATGRRITAIQVNGTIQIRAEAACTNASQSATPVATGFLYLAAGDVVSVAAWHNAGSSVACIGVDAQNHLAMYCLAAY